MLCLCVMPLIVARINGLKVKKKSLRMIGLTTCPACSFVNRSKGASLPTDFLRKSQDGKGRDYKISQVLRLLEKVLRR